MHISIDQWQERLTTDLLKLNGGASVGFVLTGHCRLKKHTTGSDRMGFCARFYWEKQSFISISILGLVKFVGIDNCLNNNVHTHLID